MTRKTSTSTDSGRSLRTLIFFCVVVFIVIAISLTYKTVTILKKSSFDGNNLYVVSFSYDKQVEVVGFYPDGKKLTHLSVGNVSANTDIEDTLGVLLDGHITLKKEFDSVNNAAKLLQDAAVFKRSAKGDFSAIDMLRLSFFARTLPPGNIESEEIRLPLDTVRTDELVLELFSDQKLMKENLTVQIINGTETSGLGKKIERLLVNRAVGVISVVNADKEQKVSRIEYSGNESYTLKKMSEFLQVDPVFSENKKIADIILVIGISLLLMGFGRVVFDF